MTVQNICFKYIKDKIKRIDINESFQKSKKIKRTSPMINSFDIHKVLKVKYRRTN